MLNASKAPSPQSSWSKEDSIWDWGFEQDSFKNPPREDFNQTIWENDTPGPVSKFDFREPLEIVDVYESQQIASSRRGTKFCLISPHSISYVPQRNLFLVSEPDQNRVGVCIIGRCEKLISPPIIMNNILNVAYVHKKNNKTIHLTLGGLGVTALSDLLEGKNTKDFQNL